MSYESDLEVLASEHPEELKKLGMYEGLAPIDTEKLNELCDSHEELRELLTEMLQYFVRYAADVIKMSEMLTKGVPEDLDRLREIDTNRTSLHDAMIDSVKIFVRNLREKGKDTAWAGGIDKRGRAGYAMFALSTIANDWEKNVRQQ